MADQVAQDIPAATAVDNIATELAPAIQQAQQDEVYKFLQTGTTEDPNQYLAGIKSIPDTQETQFITQNILPSPTEAAASAAAPYLLNSTMAGNIADSVFSPSNASSGSYSGVTNAVDSALAIPNTPGNVHKMADATAAVAGEVAKDAATRSANILDGMDNLFGRIQTAQAAVVQAQKANSAAKSAQIDAALGTDYSTAMTGETKRAVRLHAEAAQIQQQSDDEIKSGSWLKGIWHSLVADGRRQEAAAADKNANSLFSTVQNAINTTVLKQSQEYDSDLATAQAGLQNIKDQMGFLKEKGVLNSSMVEAGHKLVEALQLRASGQMKATEFDQQQKMFKLQVQQANAGLALSAESLKGQKIANQTAGINRDELVNSVAGKEWLSHILGFKDWGSADVVLKTMTDTRRNMLLDAATRTAAEGGTKINVKQYLDEIPEQDRPEAVAQFKRLFPGQVNPQGFDVMDNAHKTASAKLLEILASGRGKLPSWATAEDKKWADQYGTITDKVQRSAAQKQYVEANASAAVSDPTFRAANRDYLGFGKITQMPANVMKSIDPALRQYVTNLHNSGNEIAAAAELVQAYKAQGVTDPDKINKGVANVFKVYNDYMMQNASLPSFGLTPAKNYLVRTSALPSYNFFTGAATGKEDTVDMTSPLTISRVQDLIRSQTQAKPLQAPKSVSDVQSAQSASPYNLILNK